MSEPFAEFNDRIQAFNAWTDENYPDLDTDDDDEFNRVADEFDEWYDNQDA